jgi:hypothetical protein
MVLSVAGAVALFVSMLVGGAPETATPGVHGPPPRLEHPPRLVPSSSAPRDLSLAAKVVGGPPSMSPEEKVTLVDTIDRMWGQVVSLLKEEPNPDVRAFSLAPSHRARFADLPRRGWAAEARMGVLFQDWPVRWQTEPADLRLLWVVLDGDGHAARVVRASLVTTIAYPVILEDGAWWPALGPTMARSDVKPEDARDGWFEEGFAEPGRDPASRVTGGPAGWGEVERHELAYTLKGLVPDGSPSLFQILDEAGVSASENAGLRMHQAVFDASGERGRLVVASDARTAALSIERGGEDGWRVLKDDVQTRAGPPRPGDLDGRLDD